MHSNYIEERFNIYNEMNHGRYAIVYRAVDKRNGREVAIKYIDKDVLKKKELSTEYLINERKIFNILCKRSYCKGCYDDINIESSNQSDSTSENDKESETDMVAVDSSVPEGSNNDYNGKRHVVKLYDYHAFENSEYIVMELINGYDMQREVYERFNIRGRVQYTFEQRIDIMLQLIQGVKYLHSKNIYHGDLKPENIMLTDDRVVIVDFGCAVYNKLGYDRANKFYMKGTPGFCPPEITDMTILGNDVELAKIDVWALCCSFYYLFEGKLPFVDKNFNDMRFNEVIVALRYDQDCHPNVFKICEKVFVYEPSQRLTLDEFKSEIMNMERM